MIRVIAWLHLKEWECLVSFLSTCLLYKECLRPCCRYIYFGKKRHLCAKAL